jgi:hypothetical protein
MIPIGSSWSNQKIYIIEKDLAGKITQTPTTAVAFVPLTSKENQIRF